MLQQINNKQNYNNNNNILNDLECYTFSNKKLVQSFKNKINYEVINNKEFVNKEFVKKEFVKKEFVKKEFVKKEFVKKEGFFFPLQKDSLFWCFYIMKNGFEKYESFGEINYVSEKKIKIEYIELLRKNKNLLKSYKLTPLADLENYLLNEKIINLKTFFALCLIENLDVIYIHKKTYYELKIKKENDEDEDDKKTIPFVIIKEEESLKHGYEHNVNIEKIEQYKKTLYKLENINKPIKSMGSYKSEDLYEICKILNIDLINPLTQKKRLKKDLYELIIQILQ